MIGEGESQQTIADKIVYSGIALHSGREVQIKCFPAPADTGIVFRRIDWPGKPEIKADPFQVTSTKRCTSIGLSQEGVQVHTIEHLMAAFWALGIDNVLIEIDNAETPVGDGSARPFVDLIQRVGVKKQSRPRRVWEISEPLWVKKGQMSLIILPYDGFKISYTLDYTHPVIGTQFREFDLRENSFIEEIAPARTFGLEREVKALHQRGLALGGSLENAVLVGEKATVNALRFSDEFVRHKILDLIGDMALNGYIKGHLISIRSGHYLHVQLAQKIKSKFIQEVECL